MNQHVSRRVFIESTACASAALVAVASVASATPARIVEAKPRPKASRHLISEIKRLFNQMSPMQRVFFAQQLYALDAKEPNVFEKTADYTYEDWLAGFDQSVIDAFESGKWEAPHC